MRHAVINLLAPCARDSFSLLRDRLLAHTRFRLFETYRTPDEQEKAFARGTSKARAFESAHQFGLAADFVPWDGKQFHWPDRDHPEWRSLAAEASRLGLSVPIGWDRPHVEHRSWARVRALTR